MGDNENLISLEDYQKEVDARKALETKIQTLEQEHSGAVARLEAEMVRRSVEAIILKAEGYRDETGRAHSPVLLEWAKKVLMFESFGEGDGVVTLEDRDDAAQVRGYTRKAVDRLLDTLPGAVPMSETQTEPDSKRRLESDEIDDEELLEEAKSFWNM